MMHGNVVMHCTECAACLCVVSLIWVPMFQSVGMLRAMRVWLAKAGKMGWAAPRRWGFPCSPLPGCACVCLSRWYAQRSVKTKCAVARHMGLTARAVLGAWREHAHKMAKLKDIYGNLVHVTAERVRVRWGARIWGLASRVRQAGRCRRGRAEAMLAGACQRDRIGRGHAGRVRQAEATLAGSGRQAHAGRVRQAEAMLAGSGRQRPCWQGQTGRGHAGRVRQAEAMLAGSGRQAHVGKVR